MDMGDVPTLYTDELLPHAGNVFDLWRDYAHLMDRLHGMAADQLTQEDFLQLLRDRNELLVFDVQNGQIVSTAQASLAKTPPQWRVYINNVVTHDDHEGAGHGRRVVMALLHAAKTRWGSDRSLSYQLTNSPQKGNAGFYEKLGFRPRTKENDNETVVWVRGC